MTPRRTCSFAGCSEILFTWLNPTDACSREHRADPTLRGRPSARTTTQTLAELRAHREAELRATYRQSELRLLERTMWPPKYAVYPLPDGSWEVPRDR